MSERVIHALLAYGRAERDLGGGTGSYAAVEAALDVLLALMFPLAPASHAKRCAWCNTWDTTVDELLARAGAPISHTCCAACAAGIHAELNAQEARA